MIIELKANGTPKDAIRQIKEKECCEKLRSEAVGRILMVGMNYQTDTKEHQCIIEEA